MMIAIAGDLFISQSGQIQVDGALMDLLLSCDYRLINLEGPFIIDDNISKVKKSGPAIKQSHSALHLLERLQVDIIALANNHIMDYGKDGYKKTKALLEKYRCIGVGTWDNAYEPLIIEDDNTRVAFFNYCEFQFGMLHDEWMQGPKDEGCAWINHSRVNKNIIAYREKVDYIIAICHAGLENVEVPLPEWRNRYRELIDIGCDAVIAHHPHVVQGYEIYQKKPICYSLGNFCFPSNKEYSDQWNIGAIAMLELGKNGIDLDLIGCKYDHGYLSLMDHNSFQEIIQERNSYLQEDKYMQEVNKKCLRMLEHYWNLFAAGGLFNPQKMNLKNLGRLVLGKYDTVHLLNNLQCESHRWCVERALRNMMNQRTEL